MIAALEYGVEGMRAGGLRHFRAGPHLAYRDEGVEGVVISSDYGLRAVQLSVPRISADTPFMALKQTCGPPHRRFDVPAGNEVVRSDDSRVENKRPLAWPARVGYQNKGFRVCDDQVLMLFRHRWPQFD